MINNSDYDSLLNKYRDLQLRVTQFSSIEQQLINTRDKLDQELVLYKRLHKFNSDALKELYEIEFIQLIAENIIDIFEAEAGIVYIEKSESDEIPILYSEGIQISEIQKSLYIQDIKQLGNKFGSSKSAILHNYFSENNTSLNIFSDGLFNLSNQSKNGYSIYLLGLITKDNAPLYSQLEERQETIFSIFSQKVYSIFLNREKNRTIQEQIKIISSDKMELQKLSLIATNTANGVIISDDEGKIEWVNDAFIKTTGYTLNEVKGKKPGSFLQGNDTSSDTIKQIRDSINKKEKVETTIINYNKKGESYYNQLSITPVFNENNKLIHFIALQKNITSDVMFQKQILSNNLELKKINTELDNFVYSVSHDLRAPLLSIKGILSLIFSKSTLDSKTIEYLKLAEKSVVRLDGTIQDILEYSRNARIEIKFEIFDLKILLEQIHEDLKFIYNINIDFTIEIEGSHLIYADKMRINTLMKNLIGNAVKYNRRNIEHPFVKVKISRTKSNIIIKVIDSGEGISEKSIGKIFDMFYRGTSSSVGTGLGLYICKEILNKINGTISVESEINKGTTMTLFLKNEII